MWRLVVLLVSPALAMTHRQVTADQSSLVDDTRASDEMIGGYGVEEPVLTSTERFSAAAASLLEQDEGLNNDVTQVPQPDVLSSTEEIVQAHGHTEVMKNSGIGHMVGENTKILNPSRQLVQKANSKAAEVNSLTEAIEKLKNEQAEKLKQLEARKAANQKLLDDIRTAFQAKLQTEKSEHQQHLSSVKREAAIKVKRVRNQMEQEIDSTHHNSQESLNNFRAEAEKMLSDLKEKARAAQAREQAANSEAEHVYSQNRALWKTKHDREVEAHGVKGLIDQATKEMQLIQARLDEAKKRETELKSRLKEQARDKLLTAARLKNLHNREEQFKETEQKYKIENEHLRHEIKELDLTQNANKQEVNAAEQAAQQAVAEAAKEAGQHARVEVEHFEQKTLKALQDEISELKAELKRRVAHESHAEQELLQQEHNAQAEKKEADDAVAKAQYELGKAQEQVQLELVESQKKSREVVDEARRTAAAIRETARAGGENEGRLEAQGLIEKQAQRQDSLRLKESEIHQMSSDFKEKMDKQITNHDLELTNFIDKERQRIKAEVDAGVENQLKQDESTQEQKIQEMKNKYLAERSRAEQEEKQTHDIELDNEKLQSEASNLKSELERQKQELARAQMEGQM
eukprot:c177_g1_i1.p1 GENE.c177_g1_i1~~c177_g1_i1.p1  ORF type:complete len:632 (-),score=163.85 c177_g1_i1:29-1924(-)